MKWNVLFIYGKGVKMKNEFIPVEKGKYKRVRPKYHKQFYYIIALIVVVEIMILCIIII